MDVFYAIHDCALGISVVITLSRARSPEERVHHLNSVITTKAILGVLDGSPCTVSALVPTVLSRGSRDYAISRTDAGPGNRT